METKLKWPQIVTELTLWNLFWRGFYNFYFLYLLSLALSPVLLLLGPILSVHLGIVPSFNIIDYGHSLHGPLNRSQLYTTETWCMSGPGRYYFCTIWSAILVEQKACSSFFILFVQLKKWPTQTQSGSQDKKPPNPFLFETAILSLELFLGQMYRQILLLSISIPCPLVFPPPPIQNGGREGEWGAVTALNTLLRVLSC